MASLRQQVNAFVSANLAPPARSARLAKLAKDMLAELIASRKAGPTYTRTVDGRAGAAEESVRGTGGGSIVYRFSYAAEAAVFALAFLRARAPSASGKFRDSFYLGINGRFVPAAQFNPLLVPADAEITIGDTQPYSRRVDVQLIGSHALKYRTPAGMFDDATRAVKRQFGGTITAKRVYTLNFPGQYVLRGEGKSKKGRGTRVQSPAIVLAPLAS